MILVSRNIRHNADCGLPIHGQQGLKRRRQWVAHNDNNSAFSVAILGVLTSIAMAFPTCCSY